MGIVQDGKCKISMAGELPKFYKKGLAAFDYQFLPFNAYNGDDVNEETEFHTLSSECETPFLWVDLETQGSTALPETTAVQLPRTYRLGLTFFN